MGRFVKSLLIGALVVAVVGCGGAREGAWDQAVSESPTFVGGVSGEAASSIGSGSEATVPPSATMAQGPNDGAQIARKIVYNADVDVVVERFDPIPEQVRELAERFGGYVARSDLTGSPGSRRTGEWTLRIPVEHYEACLAAARGLGEVRRVRSDSQDVSEEFYDLEARVRNKKEEEERLRRHLADSTGKLEDILAVEKEIARVRGEIERLEGRVRLLSDLTAFSTIRLKVDEIRDYVPDEAPTYGTQVRRALRQSLSSMLTTAQALSIVAVAAAPWLVVIAVVGWLAWACLRRCRRGRFPERH